MLSLSNPQDVTNAAFAQAPLRPGLGLLTLTQRSQS